MELELKSALIEGATVEKTSSILVEEYSETLQRFGLNFRVDDYYVHVGMPTTVQGWIIHVSVVPRQLQELLQKIVPVLIAFDLPFKTVKNKTLHTLFNGGDFGVFKIGKVVTIFLDNEQCAVPFLEELISATSGFAGPEITTDFKIAEVIYTRYGSFVNEVATDWWGNRIVLIKDSVGNVAVDQYSCPPLIPTGFSNPFLPLFQNIRKPRREHLIADKYMPVKLLKRDSKGDVWKGVYLSKFLVPKWCIIKQGRKGMFPDDFGRDVTARIEWQAQINRILNGKVRNASVIDMLWDDAGAYLVTEYIPKSKDAIKSIFSMLANKPWFMQDRVVRREVIALVVQILDMIKAMHNGGHVHRDISGTNFLVDKKGRVVLIDLELSYSILENYPSPAFTLGTYGFMSPQQEAKEVPSKSDDIYSLGALLIMVFTGGLLPHYFIEEDRVRLRDKLNFFVREHSLVDLMIDCINPDPYLRPSLSEVHRFFTHQPAEPILSVELDFRSAVPVSDLVQNVLDQGICALGTDLLADKGLWYSNIENQYGPEIYPLKRRHFYKAIYRGVGGVLLTLSQFKRNKIDISHVNANVETALNFLLNDISAGLDGLHPSYYYGRAGIAALLCDLNSSALLPVGVEYKPVLLKCFTCAQKEFSLIHGLAGQGVALMKCAGHIDYQFMINTLKEYSEILVAQQGRDGSWLLGQNGDRINGMAYGIAGVAYFLFEYGIVYGVAKAVESGERALSYLWKAAHKSRGKVEWPYSNKNKGVGTWWCNGGAGIALAYLKAYEASGKYKYVREAERILTSIPPFLVFQDLSQCHGLSGVGEAYLEAFKVTGDTQWYERAGWLVNVIINQATFGKEKGINWHTTVNEYSTADFMIGTSGVLHFLARYTRPKEIPFPLL